MPKTSAKKKCFVLDTNVILHDSSCIYHFAEHDVVIPITVLEELDTFKKGNDTLHFHAREFARTLDTISGTNLFKDGIELGEGRGTISIYLEKEFHPDIAANFSDQKPDHRILNTAFLLVQERKKEQVVLVTKDVNLRMKARAMGIPVEDYTTDHVKDLSSLTPGIQAVEPFCTVLIDQLYSSKPEIDPVEVVEIPNPLPNECYILKGGSKSALARYDADAMLFRRVEKKSAYGITPRNAEQSFAMDHLLNDEIKLLVISGKAGTGKTLLAIAAALECRKQYAQIYVSRPIVPLSNRDIGFLPGDVDAKIAPYMQPLHDNLGVIKNQFHDGNKHAKRIGGMMELDKLKITPLTYIRGRSLVRTYFIVDEAQNLTPMEIKTIITRAGEGTKLVFTGDINQIDHPYLDSHSNGLTYLISRMSSHKLFAHIALQKGERSELAELAADLL